MKEINSNANDILYLLNDSSNRIQNGINIVTSQHQFLQTNGNNSSISDKINYLSFSYFAADCFIAGCLSLFKAMKLIDKKEGITDNLYDIWIKLPEEEKSKVINDIYFRYKELYKRRAEVRGIQLREVPSLENMNSADVETKLRINTDLYLNPNKNGLSKLPDIDFLNRFSVGLVRHFINDYLYSGKMLEIQKQNIGYNAFDGLKSIVDEDDESFKRITSRYYETDTSIQV